MRHAHRTALDGEVLRIDVDGTAVNQAVAGHHARVGIQHVQLDKARRIQKLRNALPCQQLAGLLLLCAELRVALQDRQLALADDGQIAFHIHSFSPPALLVKQKSQ